MSSKARTVTVWALAVLLALLFLMSGVGKLTNGQSSTGLSFDEQFEAWGYPAWFRVPVGLAEVAGAIGLLVPRLRSLAAGGLALVMAGAAVTHLRLPDERMFAAVPVVLGLLAATVAWLARPAWLTQRLAARRASKGPVA